MKAFIVKRYINHNNLKDIEKKVKSLTVCVWDTDKEDNKVNNLGPNFHLECHFVIGPRTCDSQNPAIFELDKSERQKHKKKKGNKLFWGSFLLKENRNFQNSHNTFIKPNQTPIKSSIVWLGFLFFLFYPSVKRHRK